MRNKWFIAGMVFLLVYFLSKRNVLAAPPTVADYGDDIRAAEDEQGIPRNMLARLLYRESGFRPEVISGEIKSPAGAVGIAQIIPRYHPKVDPTDAVASIWYAAYYLKTLKDQFGTWDMALAAYNWGPGNLKQKGYAEAPLETRQYVAYILNRNKG